MGDTIHISLVNVVLYGNNIEKTNPILSGISGDIHQQAITAIIGPSGGGKSTLLRLMNALNEPDEGDLYLMGVPYKQIHPRELRRKVGMVFQEPILFPGTVESNLQFPCQMTGKCPPEWEDSARSLLQQVNLDPVQVWKRDVSDFSLGEKQRIALVRTLLTNPEVILLDEPTASLDPGNSSFIVNIIRQWNMEKHLTVVWVTHTMDVARQVADRVWVIHKGQLIEEGDAATVFDNPTHEDTRRFMNGDVI
jgi:putative ABC transport system ATP-binding protein